MGQKNRCSAANDCFRISEAKRRRAVLRSISYRAKLRLRKLLKISLIVLSVLLVCSIVGFVYLQRFLVYSPDGVRIDFSLSQDPLRPDQIQNTEATAPSVEIIYNEAAPEITEDSVFTGYYIDIEMLQDPDAVYEAIQTLQGPAVVMIDLKSPSGAFYYSTAIEGATIADIDVTTVDAIIAHLRTHGFTVIARIQAFRDRSYAIDHQVDGLAISGGALWSDGGYYWLDPGQEIAQLYLEQIAKDLSSRGITEVVFDDFYFPGSSSIVYEHDVSRTELMNSIAESLISHFNSTNITISFGDTSTDFTVSDKRSHIFFSDIDASKVNSVMSSFSGLPSAKTQLVFLTNSKDTRFDGHNLLRPLPIG